MAKKEPAFDVDERRASRLGAVQALYQMDMSGIQTEVVIEEFKVHRLGQEIEGVQYTEADVEHFGNIINGVVDGQVDIDRSIENSLADGWTMSRIDSILRAALRCAVFELTTGDAIPARVIINEYLEVTHAFFEGDESRFVNGMLDKIAREARPTEFS
jgi:N utilization substance protein B